MRDHSRDTRNRLPDLDDSGVPARAHPVFSPMYVLPVSQRWGHWPASPRAGVSPRPQDTPYAGRQWRALAC